MPHSERILSGLLTRIDYEQRVLVTVQSSPLITDEELALYLRRLGVVKKVESLKKKSFDKEYLRKKI